MKPIEKQRLGRGEDRLHFAGGYQYDENRRRRYRHMQEVITDNKCATRKGYAQEKFNTEGTTGRYQFRHRRLCCEIHIHWIHLQTSRVCS